MCNKFSDVFQAGLDKLKCPKEVELAIIVHSDFADNKKDRKMTSGGRIFCWGEAMRSDEAYLSNRVMKLIYL